MSNRVALQDGTYDEVRARFQLPSQMACSVPRQVGATYKALWTKVKQNAEERLAGLTKKRYKGLDKPPKCSLWTGDCLLHRIRETSGSHPKRG